MPLKLLEVVPSTRKGKKWKAVFREGDKQKDVHFGAAGMEDYTIHGDEKRKEAYISRTRNQDFSRADSPASLSRYLLWNKKSLSESLRDFRKRYGV